MVTMSHEGWGAAWRRLGSGSALVVAALLVLGLGGTRSWAAPVCRGDCDGDGEVAVHELIRLVNITLGDAPLSSCASGDVNQDGEVRIDEILVALVDALYGCGAQQPCTTDSCRACAAADTLCASGPAGFYCCTLSGSLFTQLDGAAGCESSGIYPNGCWSDAGTCHDDAICLIGSTPAPSATATLTGTPTATASGVPSATATSAATGAATATPTVMPCSAGQTTACQAVCGDAQRGCCFNPTPAVTGSPTPVISCFDPSISCDGTNCPSDWYGFTACGGQGLYTDACQIAGTPGTTATPTATPTGNPTDAGTPTATAAGATATATGTDTPTAPDGATATATPTPTGSPPATCPTTNRSLSVTNNSGQTVWIGSTGSAVAPTCDCSTCATTSCIVDPTLVQNGSCKCAATDATFSGTIVCPGGSTPDAGYQYCACPGSASCGAAAACSGTPSTCYWTVPAPSSNTGSGSIWQLADGDSALFCLPPPANVQGAANPVWWGGDIFARTGCDTDGAYCSAGDCTDTASSGCPPGTGGSNGHTIFEVTMQTAIPDTYDVSIINGANVAIAAAPVGTPESAPPGFAAGYWCGAPGSSDPPTSVSACTWALDASNIPTPTAGTPTPGMPTPTPPDYRTTLLQTSCPSGNDSTGNTCFVACTTDGDCAGNAYGNTHCIAGACQCRSDADCSGGTLCGTQRAPFVTPGLLQLCGSFAGWWTGDILCSTAAGLSLSSYGALDCSTAMQDLFGCTGTNAASCYNSAGAGNPDCCGCATDASNPLSSSWPPLPAGSQCYDNNPTWAAQVQPLLVFLKDACPTAYTYPFDDPTSTFNCSTAGTQNMMGYQITLLPLPTPGS